MNNPLSLGKVEKEDYIELRNLGIGSLFAVQLIYHIERGELLFALKKTNLKDKDFSKLAPREKANYEKIHHPFIPKFYGTVKDDYSDFLVIEFINGQTLNECQFDGYDENDIIRIIYELLSIVEVFHDNNFLIRDLKPNNLMITKQKDIVMIDFDRVIEKSAQTHSHDLNNEYAAPEVKTKELYSEKSDIYSLGKVIDYILKKVNPKMKISEINDILEKCFQDNSEKRPSIIEIICDYLKIQNISSILSILNFQQTHFNQGVIYEKGEYVELLEIKKNLNQGVIYQGVIYEKEL